MPYDKIRLFALLFTLVPVVLGLATICRGVLLTRRAAARSRTGQLALGLVVDNQMRSRSEGRLTFHPVVRFTPASGAPVTIVGSDESDTSFVTGSTVEVRYDPAEPNRADLAGARPGRGYVGIGVTFVVLGLLALAAFAVLMPGDDPFGSPGDGGWFPFGADEPTGDADLPSDWEEQPEQ